MSIQEEPKTETRSAIKHPKSKQAMATKGTNCFILLPHSHENTHAVVFCQLSKGKISLADI